ncbi:MAG: AAA family ATPase [Anaerolineae bacterium]|nr:AAA family ATPase [Anaerolineae bacterium]
MNTLPNGLVTFLFTDVEGSTGLFQRYPDAMPAALARHDAIIRASVTAHHGKVFLNAGDGFCTVFPSATEAVLAALDAQIALITNDWGETGPLRVRMGLHTGAAEARGAKYLASLTLARVQRIMAAGHGGQTLLSSATAEAASAYLPAGTHLQSLGEFRLRGLTQPELVFQLLDPDLPANFPPLRAVSAEHGLHGATPLSQLVRDQLVGRSSELQQLQLQWQAALAGRGSLVTISGEPGVGKTRLADEFIRGVQNGGASVLRGGSYEYEATTPYLPFVEALRDWARQQPVDTLRRLPPATAAELSKLAPELELKLGSLPPNPPLSASEERLRLFDHVARFLQDLAEPGGLLLFLDDLHWADQGTLSLLRYLLRSMRGDRVLVLAAYREVELNRTHPLAAAMVDWNRERLVTRLPLGRLTRADTRELLSSLLGEGQVSTDFADLVYSETDGNPFFVEEVIKALIEQQEIFRAGDHWERRQVHELTVPQSIKEAIGRRLSRLSDESADTLVTAAALGKQFNFTELVVTSDADEDSLLDALDEAVSAQLIVPAGEESFVFTHDKIREVLVEEQNPIRRRRLHRRIAGALEGLYADKPLECPADLAYHYSLAGILDRALHYYLIAADCARRVFAHEEALAYLRRARDAAEDLDRDEQVVAIDIAIGQVHREHGMWLLAAEAYQRALDQTIEAPERARLKALVGEAYMHVGDQRGLPYLEAAVLELNPDAQPAQLAMAWASLGRYQHYAAAHRQAIEYLDRARELAEAAGNDEVLVLVQSFLAGAYQHMGRFDEADRWAIATVELGKRRGLPSAESLGYEFLSENAMNRGYWDECIRYARLNHDIGQRIGALDRVAWAGYPQSAAWYAKGDLRRARGLAVETLEMAERIGEARLSTWLDAHLVRVCIDLDEWAVAEQYARSGVERADALGQLALQVFNLSSGAYMHMLRGEWTEAAAIFGRLYELSRPTDNRMGALDNGSYHVLSLLRTGRLAEAETLLDEFETLAVNAGAVHPLAEARHMRGLVLAERGQVEEGIAVLGEAIAELERLGSQPAQAWTLLHRAELHRQLGRPDDASTDANQSRQIFERCGAVGHARRAAALA